MIHSSVGKHAGITFNLLALHTEIKTTNESLKEGREFVWQEKTMSLLHKFFVKPDVPNT